MPQQKIPRPGASWDDWQQYALTFNGYEYAGSTEALWTLYEPIREAILRGEQPTGRFDDLRAALFAHQRHHRWLEPWGDDEVAQTIADAILAALHAAS